MHVTEAHLDFYKEQGYVIIEGGLSDADLAPIIEDHVHIVDEIARDLYERGQVADLYEREPFTRRLARLSAECGEVELDEAFVHAGGNVELEVEVADE